MRADKARCRCVVQIVKPNVFQSGVASRRREASFDVIKNAEEQVRYRRTISITSGAITRLGHLTFQRLSDSQKYL